MRAAILALLTACTPEIQFTHQDDIEHIEGAGDMTVTPESLHFGEMSVGVARSLSVRITSVGDTVLQVRAATLTDDGEDAFYLDEESYAGLALARDRSVDLVVVCTLLAAEARDGVLRIESNDRERAVLDVPLLCTPTGWEPADTGDTGA